MSKSKSVKKCIPVKAYSPGPKLLKHYNVDKSWIVPCPFCERIHLHGPGEGNRLSHCPPKNQWHDFEFEGRERPESYDLVFAGDLNDAKVFVEADRKFERKCRSHREAEEKRRKERRAKQWHELKSPRNSLPKRTTSPSIR
jgi:hypothetical protein